jgi:hypothetical protein
VEGRRERERERERKRGREKVEKGGALNLKALTMTLAYSLITNGFITSHRRHHGCSMNTLFNNE